VEDKIRQFQEDVWNYYARHGRTMPWRIIGKSGQIDPYHVLVSEIMLQQTQVQRVIPKYEAFIKTFPTVHDLAQASLGDVIRMWQGLGYNRRAKFLWQTAHIISDTYAGDVPLNEEKLVALPGIGKNTALAICCYAANVPVAFVETNIRTVYIHYFFSDKEKVADADILQLVELTYDREDPRQWYWALMDYGTYLKSVFGNSARQSSKYSKQSAFNGSLRQIRGQVLKHLSQEEYSLHALQELITDTRLHDVLVALQKEGFIIKRNNRFELV
jgi:A/G-specific adenine glycosylase